MKSPENSTLEERMMLPQFPRSAKYDPEWVLENEMGPSSVWLTEWLCEAMKLEPGMRVLDMGCGKAMSSIFLAREFGVEVWATDLWIGATENLERIKEAGLDKQIFPIHAEAHTLPYADKFFDAMVCVDSYNYYGTDDIYLSYISKFIKPDAQLGIVVPGLMQPLPDVLPEYFMKKWDDGSSFWDPAVCFSIHTCEWWQKLWSQTGLVKVELADTDPESWKHWLLLEEIKHERNMLRFGEGEMQALRVDQGAFFGFVRMVARRLEDVPSPYLQMQP